jgi:hypothetical protein
VESALNFQSLPDGHFPEANYYQRTQALFGCQNKSMSFELIKISESKSAALKKHIPEDSKALRSEMTGLYSRIADSVRRRTTNHWSH